MPRDATRTSTRFEVLDGGMELEIRERGATLWVALSGILDGPRLEQVVQQVAPRLTRRGRRIVLDGSRLLHLDYRAVPRLIAWHDALRPFQHQLFLSGWNAYLKAILLVEDWDRRLSAAAWRPAAGFAGEAAWPDGRP